MYAQLTFFHSIVRWLVLVSMLYALYRAAKGYVSKLRFTKVDDAVRHWTATIAHIQLMIGMVLYFQSPSVKYFWASKGAVKNTEITFFSAIHSVLMIAAIVIVTIGSAMTKRKDSDIEKFRTMLVWYSIALALIFVAIPWPFSPFANRPYFR